MRSRAASGALIATCLGGCGGGESSPARGPVVSEALVGYELRLPSGWKALGREDDQSPFRLGGGGRGCHIEGGAPGPPVDDPAALLAESRRNYELHAEKTPGARTEFELVEVPDGAVAVEGRITGPGEQRGVVTRIVSASAAIVISCEVDAERERQVSDDLTAIYATVRMQTSEVAERMQPKLAGLPAITAARVLDEPGQLSAELEAAALKHGERPALQAARLLHEAAPSKRVAVLVSELDDLARVIQAQIEQGSDEIFFHAPGRSRKVPLGG